MPNRARSRAPRQCSSFPRARAVQSDFALIGGDGGVVATICRRLDGLPLAIELAAARISMLPPAAMLARLDQRQALLTGGMRDAPARQRTMRDTIAWSYNLLTPDEQRLLRCVAVFAGGFTLEGAAAVAAEPDVFDGISSLLDQSLLQTVPGQEAPRYQMLETIRDFGLEQLTANDEEAETRRRHAACMLALCEGGEQGFSPAILRIYDDQLELEHDNLRAALNWAIATGDVDTAQRIVAVAGQYYMIVRGHFREDATWVERVLALGVSPTPGVHERVLFAAAQLFRYLGDPARAVEYGRQALTEAEQNDDAVATGMAFYYLALATLDSGEREAAERLLADAVHVLTPLTYVEARMRLAGAVSCLASLAAARNELARAQTLATEGLTRAQDLASDYLIASTLLLLTDIARQQGHLGQATAYAQQSLALYWTYKNKLGQVTALRAFASTLTAGRQQAIMAARVMGAAASLASEIGYIAPPETRPFGSSSARSLLGDVMYEEAFAAGAELPLEHIIDEALAIAPEKPDATSARPTAARILSARETEVARLIAQGRTNPEIAGMLSISPRTVESHVRHILTKINADTRAAIAAWAVHQGLA